LSVPGLITLQSSGLGLGCLSLRLRMSLSSHCGLFADLGHGDGTVLHDLDAERVRVMDWFVVGIFLVEFEPVCLEGIQLDSTARREVAPIDKQPAATSQSPPE
jgi:hypothetical protein